LNAGQSGIIFPSIAIVSGASPLAFGTTKLLDLFPDVAYMGNSFAEAFWGCWLALPGPGDRSWAQGPGGLLAGVQKTGSGTQRQHKTSRVLLPIRAQLQQLVVAVLDQPSDCTANGLNRCSRKQASARSLHSRSQHGALKEET
jgi:hypothetical protein